MSCDEDEQQDQIHGGGYKLVRVSSETLSDTLGIQCMSTSDMIMMTRIMMTTTETESESIVNSNAMG